MCLVGCHFADQSCRSILQICYWPKLRMIGIKGYKDSKVQIDGARATWHTWRSGLAKQRRSRYIRSSGNKVPIAYFVFVWISPLDHHPSPLAGHLIGTLKVLYDQQCLLTDPSGLNPLDSGPMTRPTCPATQHSPPASTSYPSNLPIQPLLPATNACHGLCQSCDVSSCAAWCGFWSGGLDICLSFACWIVLSAAALLHVLLCTNMMLTAALGEHCGGPGATLLQDTALEQQLITAGADPQQAKDTIAAFQAASASSSRRHMLQVCPVDVCQCRIESSAAQSIS